MLSFLLACATTGSPPADSAADSAAPADAPYLYEEDEPPVPGLSLADLVLTLNEGVGAVWSYNAAPIFSAYEAGMASASVGCPNYYDYDGSAYWYDTCTSEAGTQFSGYSFYQKYVGYDAGGGTTYDGASLSGVGSITSADGTRVEFGGSAYELVVTSQLPVDDPSYYTGFYRVIQGGFALSGEAAAGTWLEEDAGPDLVISTYYAPSYEGRSVTLEGSLGDLGDGSQAIVFDSVYLMSPNLVPDCPGEPYGVVSVRDGEGSWYDVIFDGPETWDAPLDLDRCDGCGEAYFRGEDLGEVCGVDFTGLLTPVVGG